MSLRPSDGGRYRVGTGGTVGRANVKIGSPTLVDAAADGCYDAARVAAISGVPKATVYWWARNDVIVSSVSPVREQLWTFSDLMALRIAAWLRHPKDGESGVAQPASPMPMARQGLAALDRAAIDLWDVETPSPLLVDRAGSIFIRFPDGVTDVWGKRSVLPEGALQLGTRFREVGG